MTVPNPVASFPVGPTSGQFRMGPLLTEDPAWDFWWNRQLADGSYTSAGEPQGWEGLSYILPLDQVGGRDGAFAGPQSVAPRELDIDALIVAPSPLLLRDNLAKIRRILGPQSPDGLRQPVIWDQHDYRTGTRWGLVTRPSGRFQVVPIPGYEEGGVCARVSFTLVAANPVWKYQTGAVETNQVGLLNPALVLGRTYSKSFSYSYGGGSDPGGSMVVINNGNIAAHAVFYVTGPADHPIISNVTSGQAFQVLYDIPAGSANTVRIDSRTGAVTPASVRLAGRPFLLQPGANTITWRTASGSYDPGALLRMEWRSTAS